MPPEPQPRCGDRIPLSTNLSKVFHYIELWLQEELGSPNPSYTVRWGADSEYLLLCCFAMGCSHPSGEKLQTIYWCSEAQMNRWKTEEWTAQSRKSDGRRRLSKQYILQLHNKYLMGVSLGLLGIKEEPREISPHELKLTKILMPY